MKNLAEVWLLSFLQKERKLLIKILKKILDHPTNKKYHSLNGKRLHQKLGCNQVKTRIFFKLLCMAGFCIHDNQLLYDNKYWFGLNEVYKFLLKSVPPNNNRHKSKVYIFVFFSAISCFFIR